MEKVVHFYADDSKEVFFMTNYICILKKIMKYSQAYLDIYRELLLDIQKQYQIF